MKKKVCSGLALVLIAALMCSACGSSSDIGEENEQYAGAPESGTERQDAQDTVASGSALDIADGSAAEDGVYVGIAGEGETNFADAGIGTNTGVDAQNKDLTAKDGNGGAKNGSPKAQPASAAGGSPESYRVFDGALFIGDSRTEGLSLHAGIEDADFFCAKSLTIDRIVSGEAIKVGGAATSINSLLESKSYSRVYISLGLNELGWVHIEKFLNEYKTLIGMVREAQPEAVIYVEALLPVTSEKSDQGGTTNNAQIYWYNTHLVELADETGTTYLNADAPLVGEDGYLLPEATTDGVHLKSDYCKLWAEELAELSQE